MSFASLPPSHPRYRAPLPSARAEADALHASTDAQPAFVPAERPGGAPKRARFAAPAALPQLSASAAVAAGVDPALLADRRRWFPAEYATWRKDKRAAWDVLPEHPDAFYLKYLPPGEKAREGAWTEEEEATFLRMLGEHRFAYEGKWGLFSMYIRGRTGLQCKAFYEGLAKTQKLGAARRAVRPRASAAHAPAASDGGADALPEPIARMTEQRARRRRDKEAAAAACAAESSPITSDDEMPTEEPLRSASPMPATPPTAEPTTELTDGGGDGDKSMPAPGSVRPLKPAFAPPASTPAQAQTPAAGIAGHQVPSTPLPHITPMPHRPATEQDARASGAPTARAAPRMQHKEPRQVCLPMPMPAFGTASAVDPAAAAAASQAHGALLARIALAAAASRPFAPMRPLAAAPLQEAPAPRVPEPAASEPARAMADEKEKQASASASATAMATLASACELVRPGPSPAPAPTAPGELGCLAPARAVAVDEVHAEPNADSMAGAQTGAAAAMCTVAAALQVVPATEGPAAEEEQQEQPAAEASLPRPHSPVQTLVAESAAPSAAEIDVLARGVGSPAAMPLPALVSSEPPSQRASELGSPLDSEWAQPLVSSGENVALPSEPPLAHAFPRTSPPTLKLSPVKGRALFLEQLKAHHDYCRLQQARLAMVEAEQHEALRMRLAGHISPFERACAALAPEPAKSLKKLHATAAAWSERPEQGARSELSRSHEAARAALLAQQKMESAAMRAMSVWFRQRGEPEQSAQ